MLRSCGTSGCSRRWFVSVRKSCRVDGVEALGAATRGAPPCAIDAAGRSRVLVDGVEGRGSRDADSVMARGSRLAVTAWSAVRESSCDAESVTGAASMA